MGESLRKYNRRKVVTNKKQILPQLQQTDPLPKIFKGTLTSNYESINTSNNNIFND
ncbi:hypothetical protein RINTHH_14760 [Richelia intracellularis HH01]|uniref:Uncharacterized protein n=1 Tax=Richelia intracellularis HH01 TaxID=1165094 RepID=M1X5V1_9NOST|nr:hypothetical protein RINTHH_14760 [Richelia intracellularis HH01]